MTFLAMEMRRKVQWITDPHLKLLRPAQELPACQWRITNGHGGSFSQSAMFAFAPWSPTGF